MSTPTPIILEYIPEWYQHSFEWKSQANVLIHLLYRPSERRRILAMAEKHSNAANIIIVHHPLMQDNLILHPSASDAQLVTAIHLLLARELFKGQA